MNALARDRVQERRKGGDQGLPFSRPHLCDLPLVEHDPAHELHIEVSLSDRALRGLTNQRKSLRQEVVERLALLVATTQFADLAPHAIGIQRLHFRFERIDPLDERTRSLEQTLVGRTKDLAGETPNGALQFRRAAASTILAGADGAARRSPQSQRRNRPAIQTREYKKARRGDPDQSRM